MTAMTESRTTPDRAPQAGVPAAAAATLTAQRFAAAAAAHGYDDRARAVMVNAAVALRLPMDQAAGWLEADITPWGAMAWKEEGFADGAEARTYRARGFTPVEAYQARRDERARARVAARN
jgi:hypothetical protein